VKPKGFGTELQFPHFAITWFYGERGLKETRIEKQAVYLTSANF